MATGKNDTSPVEKTEGPEGDAAETEGDQPPPDGEGDGDPGNYDDEEEGGDTEDDDGVVWEELFACPLAVRFTQDNIHPFFYRRGPIEKVLPQIRIVPHSHSGDSEPLGVSPAEAARGMVLELVPPFGPIHCLQKGKHLWSLDNRRLWALQAAAMRYWPQQCCVRLNTSDRLPRKKFKTQYRKFKTQSEGQIVHIKARFQHFTTWSWFEHAVEIEGCGLNHQFGVVLSAFETLPVIGVLLFRTGLTGLTSRVPLIIALILSLGLDFIRQKVPVFEKKIAELHVKAIMDGDIKFLPSWRKNREARLTSNGYEDTAPSVSAPQLAAIMALLMVLTLPYVLAIAHDKVRSSIFSCWLGISCVLVVQLGGILRAGTQPEVLMNSGQDDDEGEHRLPKAPRSTPEDVISPKHRD